MSKISERFVPVCNFISSALMVVVAIFQFLPFWQYDGTTTSISSYVWFPQDKDALELYLRSQVGSGFTVDEIVISAVGTVVFSIVGILFCLWKWDNFGVSILPVICGGCGLWGYLTEPVMRLGVNWQWQALVCGILCVTGLLSLGIGFCQYREEKRHRREKRYIAR